MQNTWDGHSFFERKTEPDTKRSKILAEKSWKNTCYSSAGKWTSGHKGYTSFYLRSAYGNFWFLIFSESLKWNLYQESSKNEIAELKRKLLETMNTEREERLCELEQRLFLKDFEEFRRYLIGLSANFYTGSRKCPLKLGMLIEFARNCSMKWISWKKKVRLWKMRMCF